MKKAQAEWMVKTEKSIVLIGIFAVAIETADLNVLDRLDGGGSGAAAGARRWFDGLPRLFFLFATTTSAALGSSRPARATCRPAKEHLHLFQGPSFCLGQEPKEKEQTDEGQDAVEPKRSCGWTSLLFEIPAECGATQTFAGEDFGEGEEGHGDEKIEKPIGGCGDAVASAPCPERIDFGIDGPRHGAHSGREEEEVRDESEDRDPAVGRRAPAEGVGKSASRWMTQSGRGRQVAARPVLGCEGGILLRLEAGSAHYSSARWILHKTESAFLDRVALVALAAPENDF